MPTLQNKLLVREEYSSAREAMPRLSLVSVYKTHVANIYSTIKVSTASAIECTLYVLRLLARVLVSSKSAIVESKALI